MTYKAVISALIFSFLIALAVGAQTNIQGVAGWFMTGSKPSAYTTATVAGAGQSGEPALHMRGNNNTGGFGTFMQMFSATKYEGQRVRLSANIKAENLKGTAGLWMRMDGADGKLLGFDNMQDRPIVGTTEWKSYAVVLDVAPGTRKIAIGVLMTDGGNLWMENVKFETVPNSTPTTGISQNDIDTMNATDRLEPKNLDFKNR